MKPFFIFLLALFTLTACNTKDCLDNPAKPIIQPSDTETAPLPDPMSELASDVPRSESRSSAGLDFLI